MSTMESINRLCASMEAEETKRKAKVVGVSESPQGPHGRPVGTDGTDGDTPTGRVRSPVTQSASLSSQPYFGYSESSAETSAEASAETTLEADVAATLRKMYSQSPEVPTVRVIIIESYVIANHFKSLIRWSVDPESTASSNPLEFPFVKKMVEGTVTRKFAIHQSVGLSVLSWTDAKGEKNKMAQMVGKMSGNESDNIDENEDSAAVTLSVDTKNKAYSLTIRAPSASEVEDRMHSCDNLIKHLDQMSQRVTLAGNNRNLHFFECISLLFSFI